MSASLLFAASSAVLVFVLVLSRPRGGLFPHGHGLAWATAWAVVLLLGFFAALPGEGSAGALGAFLNGSVGAALPEASASRPFARFDLEGAALAHAGATVVSTSGLRIAIDTLVALIAGGVTAFVAWLLTGLSRGVRSGEGAVAGVKSLGAGPERGAFVVGTLLWMGLTWVLFMSRNWHILGTLRTGEDVLLVLLGALPASLAWGVMLAVPAALLGRFLGDEADRAGRIVRGTGAALAAGILIEGSLGWSGYRDEGLGFMIAGLEEPWARLAAGLLWIGLFVLAAGLARAAAPSSEELDEVERKMTAVKERAREIREAMEGSKKRK